MKKNPHTFLILELCSSVISIYPKTFKISCFCSCKERDYIFKKSVIILKILLILQHHFKIRWRTQKSMIFQWRRNLLNIFPPWNSKTVFFPSNMVFAIKNEAKKIVVEMCFPVVPILFWEPSQIIFFRTFKKQKNFFKNTKWSY